MKLSEDLLDAIDGGEECRGRDSQISRWADMAKRVERDRAELIALVGNCRMVLKFEHTLRPDYGWLEWITENIDPVLSRMEKP